MKTKNSTRQLKAKPPIIDLTSQVMILMYHYNSIFLDIFFSLPDLLSEVKLTVGEISRDLTELVHTFW